MLALANYITKYNVKELTVYGHASAPVLRTYNMKLSRDRAESLAGILQVKFNIDKNILTLIERGEEDLLDESDTYGAHQLNRRSRL